MCKYVGICERQMCMFRHEVITDAIIEVIDDEVDIHEKTFSNPAYVELPSEFVEYRDFAPCRDICLKNDQTFYWRELEKFSEIEKVEHLYVHSRSGYKVGTYLQTYMKFKTK